MPGLLRNRSELNRSLESEVRGQESEVGSQRSEVRVLSGIELAFAPGVKKFRR